MMGRGKFVGRATLGVALLSMLVGRCAVAQEPAAGFDPFGESPAAPVTVRPAARPAAEKAEPVETDPNVLAIRLSKPQSPVALMTAVENLLNFGRPDEAKKYLQQLLGGNPDEAALWSLQQKFGSALFIRIATEKGLEPEGRQLSDAVLNAAHKGTRDPGRLQSLIQHLADPSIPVRRAAVADLRLAGEDGAVALLEVLGDPNRDAEHVRVRAALALLGPAAVGPVLGVLDADDEALRGQALWILGRLQTREAIPYLLHPALASETGSPGQQAAERALAELLARTPTRQEAEQYLHRRALAEFRGQIPWQPDHENRVRFWRWDAATRRPVAEHASVARASLHRTALLAGELVRFAPGNAGYRKLLVTAELESARLARAWNQPLERNGSEAYRSAAELGAPALEEVVDFALDQQHPVAALAALEVLADIGNFELLFNAAGHPSVVGRALQNPDRRVRFAAVQVIMRWDPRQRYAGASFLPEALGYFASNTGARGALIVHPRIELARALAGVLAELGVAATTVTSGAEALQLAVRNSDYDFILASDGIDRPNIGDWLQQLRREPRMAALPVALLAREENLERLQGVSELDSLTFTFPAPYDVEGMRFLVGRLMSLAGDGYLEPEERLEQAKVALDHLARLAESPERYGFYDLLRQQPAVERAMYAAPLTARACRVLGLLATPTAQQLLVSLASQNERSLAERQAAAAAFGAAVKRRGLLLTRREILVQYDRYNASEKLDEATQQLLGVILDSIEGPAAQEEPR